MKRERLRWTEDEGVGWKGDEEDGGGEEGLC